MIIDGVHFQWTNLRWHAFWCQVAICALLTRFKAVTDNEFGEDVDAASFLRSFVLTDAYDE